MTAFVGNNTKSEITKLTLFFANEDFYPRFGFEPIERTNANSNEQNTNIFANRIEEIQKILQNPMFLAQIDHEKYIDEH